MRDKHKIRSMLFMGGEPMIRKALVFEAMKLFDACSIVTNGTYGIPSVPGQVVTVSLDGPEALNDPIRGAGVFQKVKKAVFERDPSDGTTVILQMAITRQNEAAGWRISWRKSRTGRSAASPSPSTCRRKMTTAARPGTI